jgi:hypothetical protein
MVVLEQAQQQQGSQMYKCKGLLNVSATPMDGGEKRVAK